MHTANYLNRRQRAAEREQRGEIGANKFSLANLHGLNIKD